MDLWEGAFVSSYLGCEDTADGMSRLDPTMYAYACDVSIALAKTQDR